MPITGIQLKGTHNSYHIKPNGKFLAFGLNTVHPGFQYAHDPILQQLDRGVRHFEFDLHFGQDRRALNYHLPFLDAATHCKCLSTCLATLKSWSDDNPNHLPLFVLMELKYRSWVEDYRAFTNLPGEDEFLSIENTILAAWSSAPERIFVPDQLRGNYTTLNDAVRQCGWPSVGEMRQKIVFALLDNKEMRDAYIRGKHAGLRNRVMFTLSKLDKGTMAKMNDDEVAMVKVDNPEGASMAVIQEAVRLGFLVRTRGSVVHDNAAKRLHSATDSGAQLITMDGDTLHADWEAHVAGQGAGDVAAARCGRVPVRAALEGCVWHDCNLSCASV